MVIFVGLFFCVCLLKRNIFGISFFYLMYIWEYDIYLLIDIVEISKVFFVGKNCWFVILNIKYFLVFVYENIMNWFWIVDFNKF